MTTPTTTGTYITLRQAARRLNLPMSWLRSEVRAKRLPHIIAARRIMLNLDQVRDHLESRAAANAENAREVAHGG